MKKNMVSIMVLLVVISQSVFAYDFPPVMRLNSIFVQSGEILTSGGEIYIEARNTTELIGGAIEWDQENRAAHFYKNEKRIVVKNDAVYTFVDGAPQGEQTDVGTFAKEGRTYLPLDFFVAFFDIRYIYNSDYDIIDLASEAVAVPREKYFPASDMQDDLKWLAKIINIEARGGSTYKKVAVANVVLNRVKSDQFPDNVYDVIKQKGQFPPAYYNYFDTFEPNTHCYVSAIHAFNDINVVEDCLYFNLKPFSWKSKSDYYGEIEGDYFYR